jgi:hypothetical protein
VLAEELVDNRRAGSPATDDEERLFQAVNPHGWTPRRDVC